MERETWMVPPERLRRDSKFTETRSGGILRVALAGAVVADVLRTHTHGRGGHLKTGHHDG